MIIYQAQAWHYRSLAFGVEQLVAAAVAVVVAAVAEPAGQQVEQLAGLVLVALPMLGEPAGYVAAVAGPAAGLVEPAVGLGSGQLGPAAEPAAMMRIDAGSWLLSWRSGLVGVPAAQPQRS